MTRRPWTQAEINVLVAAYATTPTKDLARRLKRGVQKVFAKANALGLRKTHEYLSATHGERVKAVGAKYRFAPGQKPWNAGVPGSTGQHENSRRTQFKPGVLSGRAAQLWVPVGSTRITKDGLLQRKVGTKPGPPHLRWRTVHELVWIAAHGPVPAGHIVVFRPGQRTTVEAEITLDRLELVSRAELLRRNSVHRHGPEVARLSQLKAAIQRHINRRTRAAEENAT